MEQRRNIRAPLKSSHTQWKEKLREKCLLRVKQERGALLWKIRSAGHTLPVSQVADSAFGSIVTDEIDRLKQTCGKLTSGPMSDDYIFGPILTDEIDRLKQTNGNSSSGAATDDDMMLWEYEPSGTLSELDQEDYEELMIAMQNILYEDIQTEIQQKESTLLEDFERYCTQEEHSLATALEQLESNKAGVLCPICKGGQLEQDQHIIFCKCGHLRLDVQNENVNLDFMRTRLEELLQHHHDLGCKSHPIFCTDSRFSVTALYMQCSSCEIFELVL